MSSTSQKKDLKTLRRKFTSKNFDSGLVFKLKDTYKYVQQQKTVILIKICPTHLNTAYQIRLISK